MAEIVHMDVNKNAGLHNAETPGLKQGTEMQKNVLSLIHNSVLVS